MTYQLHEKLKQDTSYAVVNDACPIRLDANESFIDPGLLLEKEIHEAVAAIPLNRYPDDQATDLRIAFGRRFKVDPDMVVAGTGSDEMIALLIGSFLQPEETLLVPEPDFAMYKIFAATYGKNIAFLQKNKELSFRWEDAVTRIQETGARIFLFSNPASPSAGIFKREDVLSLVDGTDALVVVDEAYMDFSDQSVLDAVANRKNLVVLRTCSKAMGCASIRLGFAVASREIASVLDRLRAPYNVSSVTQAIGRVVLSNDAYIDYCIQEIQASRDALYNELKKFETIEWIRHIHLSNTNYIYIETDQASLIDRELIRRGIRIRSWPDALRITCGTEDENNALIQAFTEILSQKVGIGEEAK